MTSVSNQTLFTSYDIKAKTKEVVNQNKISFKDEVLMTNEIENISYHTTINNNESIPTIFTDPTNDKYVITSMSIEVLNKLKQQFGEEDVISKEDGTIQLQNKAELFVSGWFADIAYTRNFLQSDENKDGILSDKETLNLKNAVEINVIKDDNINVMVSKTYETMTKEELEVNKIIFPNMPVSLDDELNMTLKFDSNFDGQLSLKEVLVPFNETIESLVLEDIEGLDIEGFDLSMDDMDKLLSIMEYISKLFLEMELEKKLIKMLNNSTLKKELEPEQMSKISSEELFEFITNKENNTENEKENDDSPDLKKQESKSNDNLESIKNLLKKV